jgi:hypothetical protein
MDEKSGMQAARENLLYIRKTLEAAGQVTAVSGNALIWVGTLALAAAVLNGWVTGAPWTVSDPRAALAVWAIVFVVSVVIVLLGMYRKSRQTAAPIRPPLLKKLLWSLCPALFTGAILTGLALTAGLLEWLPVIWLACYGAAVTNGGLVSIPPIRFMGLGFLIAAAGAALSPRAALLAWLALGFGWLHIVCGAYIARRYNG